MEHILYYVTPCGLTCLLTFRINILPLSSEANSMMSCLLGLFLEKFQTIRSTEMWLNFYKTSRRHITEDEVILSSQPRQDETDFGISP
jgi:hypothetical protein